MKDQNEMYALQSSQTAVLHLSHWQNLVCFSDVLLSRATEHILQTSVQ